MRGTLILLGRGTALAGLLLAHAVFATPAAAQIREPEVQTYAFVSEVANPFGFWVNPGLTAFGRPTRLSGNLTFDNPEGGGWDANQWLIGVHAGFVSFGYRHDEFGDSASHSQGDNYTLAAGYATNATGLGVARTWRTVGDNQGSWEIGWFARSASGVSAGVVWRDIGSPQVRDTVREERLIGGVTYGPAASRFNLSLQADYRLDGKEFRAFRIGGAFDLLPTLAAIALAQWSGDGDFQGFRLGLVLRAKNTTFVAGAGLNSEGDASTASAGVAFDTPRR